MFEKMYKTITGNSPEQDGVHIMDVRGLSFKRYLEIAVLLGNKVAVITDNDKDYQKHCINKYTDYANNPKIKICYDEDNTSYTFEVVMYQSNQDLCNSLFGTDAMNYMLSNKTESAFKLLIAETEICVPHYIKGAIEWIKE